MSFEAPHDQDDFKESFRLSLPEVGHLFLLRSHREACSLFERHVCTAMAESFPDAWVERIGDCFSGATRQWVMDELKNTGRITDFFVLCKTIRCYIRRVFVISKPLQGMGKRLPDFNQMEFLNTTIQSLELVRHSMFHGEDLSVEEITTALTYTARILPATLNSSTVQSSTASVDLLSSFEKDFQELNMGNTTMVCANTLEGVNVLLLRCFRKFEDELRKLLQEAVPSEYVKQCGESRTSPGISELFSLLKKYNGRQEIWALRRRGVKVNFTKVCSKLKKLRNHLAHGVQMTLSFIRHTLNETKHFWAAFQMDQTSLNQIISHLSKFEANHQHGVFEKTPSVVTLVRPVSPTWDRSSYQRRPLRQMDSIFVGRENELKRCIGFLLRKGVVSHGNDPRLLVVEGVSGVGKSALASRILHEARRSQIRQMWICASTQSILLEELGAQLFPFQTDGVAKLRIMPSVRVQRFHHILKRLPCHLIVFDDVHSDLVDLVASLIQGTQHDVIITSCHLSEVKLDTVLLCFHSHLSLCLSCLSTEASLELIHKRGINIDQHSQDIVKTIIHDKLRNLPLLVNLFSSLLRKKGSGHLRQTSMRAWLEDVSSKLENELLTEDCLGVDRFHVRGLTGLVCLTLDHLGDDRATVTLMVIIAAMSIAGTPWRLFELDWQPDMDYVDEFEGDPEAQESAVCIHQSMACLFGENDGTRLASRERLLEWGLFTKWPQPWGIPRPRGSCGATSPVSVVCRIQPSTSFLVFSSSLAGKKASYQRKSVRLDTPFSSQC